MTIPYNGWHREYEENEDEYHAIFERAMGQKKYDKIEWFENKIAEYAGRKYSVGVASGTDALVFSLLVHGIRPGDEVLVSDFSWISTASCISLVGATPVFCDIDLASYHMDVSSAKRMVTDKTKALIYPHLFGNMSDTTVIENFCEYNSISLIEDAAQALGASFNSRKAGSIGHSSIYSFNTNKVIAGINGGGMYLTDDQEHANFVRKLKVHGDGQILGYNSKLYSMNADIINQRFQKIEEYQSRRQEIARLYDSCFEHLPIFTQEITPQLNHNYHKYVIRFEDNETREFVRSLLSAPVHYEMPIHKNEMYKNLNYRKDDCANAQKVCDTILSLPIHPWLTEEEIDTVIDTVAGVF